MKFRYALRTTINVCLTAALLSLGNAASAYDWRDGLELSVLDGDSYRLMLSPYTYHYSQTPEHKDVWLAGVERQRANGNVAGVALFSNSFGQPSAYVYPWGKTYRGLFDQPQLFAKWSAGLLYGYKGQYKDKIPFNNLGIAPAVVPTIGWEFAGGSQAQVVLLGTSGLMFQYALPLR